MKNVEHSSRIMFLNTEHNVLVPAMTIRTPTTLHAVMLPNIWDTDLLNINMMSEYRNTKRSVKLAPPTHEKKNPIWELWAIYGLSNSARNNFWALPIFEKNDIEVGGLLASREASANFFPEVLREI